MSAPGLSRARDSVKAVLDRAQRAARTPAGRAIVALVGLGIVALALAHAEPTRVWASIVRCAAVIPVVFVLEALYSVLELLALRDLYGADRQKLPLSELLRAGLIAFAMGGVMPMGRPVVESVRGVALARWTSGARAAAAGTRLQYLLLLSQALLCVPCVLAALVLPAPSILLVAILINAAITFVMGAGLYLAARRGALASRLPMISKRAAELAPQLDEHLREDTGLPQRAVAFVLVGRGVQVLQYTVLVGVLVGELDLLRGLGIVGVQMVGSSLADVLPTHLGGTEALAPLGATTLCVPLSDALAIPLVIHAVQATWIVLGLAAYVLWPARSLTSEQRA